MIYKSVLFGGFYFEEAVIKTQSCLQVCTSHEMAAGLPVWPVSFISADFECFIGIDLDIVSSAQSQRDVDSDSSLFSCQDPFDFSKKKVGFKDSF